MLCELEECDLPVHRRTFCSRHYQRFMNYGDPRAGGVMRDLDRRAQLCRIDGCGKRRRARELCELHYGRLIKYGDPERLPPTSERAVCVIDGCPKVSLSRGMCSSHYNKWRRHGDPEFESTPATRRKGRRVTDGEGYVRLYLPEHPNAHKSGTVMEHTVVMSAHLGRPLMPGENVHHLNGVRSDNRLENLELWVTCQPSGQRPADLVEWARIILDRYEDDVMSSKIMTGESNG